MKYQTEIFGTVIGLSWSELTRRIAALERKLKIESHKDRCRRPDENLRPLELRIYWEEVEEELRMWKIRDGWQLKTPKWDDGGSGEME